MKTNTPITLLVAAITLLSLPSCTPKSHSRQAVSTAGDTVEYLIRDSMTYTVEDTVKYHIGGDLYYARVHPDDSITVIKTEYEERYDEEPLRAYMFINHNKHSEGHRVFEPAYLDSIYEDDKQLDIIAKTFAEELASASSLGKRFDGIEKLKGYWVYVTKYGGDYYLFDDWSFIATFHIADSICTPRAMDGPHPSPIVGFESRSNGFALSVVTLWEAVEKETWNCELVEERRSIYRKDGESYIAPAANVHLFEIIHYVVNNYDDMNYYMSIPETPDNSQTR